jgi:hypothetical protein
MLREVADPEMVATLTASRMVTACLVIAGGWLEIAVEMAPVIDVGGRCCYDGRGQGRCGVSAEPARSRRVLTRLVERHENVSGSVTKCQ